MARAPRRFPPTLGRRRGPIIQPKLKLLIFCEGKNTEPDYIKGLAAAFGNRLVTVDAKGAAGVPKTLVEKALAARKAIGSPKNSFEEGDQIWVVFDRDEHPGVTAAINLAKSTGIGVAFSNPCFEIWGILHYQDHDAPIHRHDAQRMLAGLMSGYDPGRGKSLDLQIMLPRTEHAGLRAKAMRKRRFEQGDELGCPYTDVDVLADLIISNGKA